jgi:hypothetical protein
VILLVSGATTTLAKHAGHPALGRLVQPRSWGSIAAIANAGQPWGADNDALAGVIVLLAADAGPGMQQSTVASDSTTAERSTTWLEHGPIRGGALGNDLVNAFEHLGEAVGVKDGLRHRGASGAASHGPASPARPHRRGAPAHRQTGPAASRAHLAESIQYRARPTL